MPGAGNTEMSHSPCPRGTESGGGDRHINGESEDRVVRADLKLSS